MKGYLSNPAETRAAFWDDWLRSVDLGTFDEDGYLYIVDRIKDMIITGGENVYPREIEEVLYQRSEIQECSVIGLPDKKYGELEELPKLNTGKTPKRVLDRIYRIAWIEGPSAEGHLACRRQKNPINPVNPV